MSPEFHYLFKVAPMVLALAAVGTLFGFLLGLILWRSGKTTSRRIKRECEQLREQIARARRANS